MFGALKRGRFRSLASLILVVNVVGELQRKRIAASRGFLATARLSCCVFHLFSQLLAMSLPSSMLDYSGDLFCNPVIEA